MNMSYSIKERQTIKEKHDEFWIIQDPYFYWPFYFSKAEEVFWHHIRCKWIFLIPEYPVLNYFLDFANPHEKIGIEIDGKEWHQDKNKDNKRQEEIENEGWRIIRFTWQEVFEWVKEPNREDFYDDEEWYMNEINRFYQKNMKFCEIVDYLHSISNIHRKVLEKPMALSDILDIIKTNNTKIFNF